MLLPNRDVLGGGKGALGAGTVFLEPLPLSPPLPPPAEPEPEALLIDLNLDTLALVWCCVLACAAAFRR